ncbi:M23 family metallopeptidase [Helicobacter sp. MIT 99-5507]|uniref:M23 family metallopeptidase n=1 Tax=Helicobacter sp. MIT 99-5507 TaxID=152489 RepID=UPI000E1ECCB2|nr:M23 family metallopeptidase [Helicobacter sp. MIT 99-5507]RDU58539.1 hypothetical protein CQA42_01755 [Helicobacter sp. MIT 99-5507]
MKSSNIRDKFIISIVDNNGIKQFSIHRFVKKFFIYFLLFLIISNILIFITIKLLASELKEMKTQRYEILDKYKYIYDKNKNIKQQVEISQNKLDEINTKMFDLEDIISMKDAVISNTNAESYDMSSLSQSKKETILQLLPNSFPFDINNNFHSSSLKSGIVFDLPKAIPIYATADGIIDLRVDNSTKDAGKFVKIIHSFGFTSIYGYLSKITLKRGDVVKKGQLIGYSNTTANKNLYYDIRFLGSEVDVEKFIAWNIDNFLSVINEDSIVNWNGLLWTLDDIIKIKDHKIFSQPITLLDEK